MISPKTLLTDLQKWVTKFENDLRQRCREVPELDASLKADWQKAKDSKRTAEAYEVWRDGQLTQSAVGWVLGCVFVRFLEDNQLLDRPWIAGTGDRRTEVEHVRDAFFTENPTLSDRDYLQHVFTEVGKLPGMADLFDRRHNALWRAGISGDAAAEFIAFWRKMDHDFTDTAWDTRFLGDLYQDLSEYAKDTFALLQTPEFVEEFILDRTLDPAIERFGYEQVRMIDPTCGSGHFVLGGFNRLLTHWQKGHPEMNEREIVKHALAAVAGVDINPFAVAIARFRLLLAAWKFCSITLLKPAPTFHVNLAVGDSLLHGRRFTAFAQDTGPQRTFDTEEIFRDELKHHYEVEDIEDLHRILGRQYHAVVGNPPYIAVQDKAVKAAYKARYQSCHGKWVLSVPFMERFFDLAVKGDGTPRQPAGFVGQITANSFMKREFGKKLIEEFIPRWDLTHVIDTAGAYIPGHTTPTAILFGKNQPPVSNSIRTVLGIAGEPTTPDDPSQGVVWQSILRQIDELGSVTEWFSSTNSPRSNFHRHPWSIGGGGAAELKEEIDEVAHTKLGCLAVQIGITSVTGEDDVYAMSDNNSARRLRIEVTKPLVEGDIVRDWALGNPLTSIWLYDDNFKLVSREQVPQSARLLWSAKALISHRKRFGTPMLERGLTWYEWQELYTDKLRSPISIAFAFVATHNHFVLDRGGNVFKQSAPVIKMPIDTSEDHLLTVVGILNSSTACFWLKQVCQPKATSVGDISKEKGRAEANRYEFTSTVLESFPIPDLDSILAKKVGFLARILQKSATELDETKPSFVIRQCVVTAEPRPDLKSLLASAKVRRQAIRSHMIFLQEELDWCVYDLFGLAPSTAIDQESVLRISSGIERSWRPFEWSEHGMPSLTAHQLPTAFSARRRLIETDQRVRMLESPLYKRPWLGRQGVYGSGIKTYEEEISHDIRLWLLARLETAFFEGERIAEDGQNTIPANLRNGFTAGREPRLCTTRQLADVVSHDPAFMQAASVYRDRQDFDLPKLVQELVEDESIPFLPIQRYKDSGLRKRVIWERTWDLQRQEDQIEAEVRQENAEKKLSEEQLKPLTQARQKEKVGDIPVPPKYASTDFKKPHWWKLRGKLDVPKERWITYSGTDTPSVIAWAGWNHKQQAQALASYYQDRKDQDGWSKERLAPLIAGLKDLLPWLKQWHNDIDPQFQLRLGDFYEEFVRDQIHELGMNEAQIEELRMGGLT